MTLIEITTHGCEDDPVRWQTSTFWPAVDCAEAAAFFFSCFGFLALVDCTGAECVTVERACAGCAGCDGFDGCTGWLGCDGFAGFVRVEVDGLVRFVWPGALADLPRGFAGF